MHMVEARTRRAAFLRHMVSVLELPAASVHRSEFETVIDELPTADWVTMQAVQPTVDLLTAIERISKPSTALLWITSASAAERRFARSDILSLPFSQTVAVVFRPQRDPF